MLLQKSINTCTRSPESAANGRFHVSVDYKHGCKRIKLNEKALEKIKKAELKESNVLQDGYKMDLRFNKVDYTPTTRDIRFLAKINKPRDEEISMDDFIQAIDRFNKISVLLQYKSNQPAFGAVHQVKQKKKCDICALAASTQANVILSCYVCNIRVHQDCYGVPFLPLNDWLCNRCALGPVSDTKCRLCPHRVGAFKFVNRIHPVHAVCAVWCPEVQVQGDSFMASLAFDESATFLNNGSNCVICDTNVGYVIKCTGCTTGVHATCAAFIECSMGVSRRNQNYMQRVYCPQCSKMDATTFQRYRAKVRNLLENRQPLYEFTTLRIPEEYLCPEFINPELSNEDVRFLHAYWITKMNRSAGHFGDMNLLALRERIVYRTVGYFSKWNQALRSSLKLVAVDKGALKLTVNFKEDLDYLDYIFKQQHPLRASMMLQNIAVDANMNIIGLDLLPRLNFDKSILLTTSLLDLEMAMIQQFWHFVAPAKEVKVDFSYSDLSYNVSPLEVASLFFYAFAPMKAQVNFMISTFRLLDKSHVLHRFRSYFPAEDDSIMDLTSMVKHAYEGHFRNPGEVMHAALKMTNHMLKFPCKKTVAKVKEFEDFLPYLMPPPPFVVNEIANAAQHLKRVGATRFALFRCFYQELIDPHNPELNCEIKQSEYEKIITAIDVGRKYIIAEKRRSLPNIVILRRVMLNRTRGIFHDFSVAVFNTGLTCVPTRRLMAINKHEELCKYHMEAFDIVIETFHRSQIFKNHSAVTRFNIQKFLPESGQKKDAKGRQTAAAKKQKLDEDEPPKKKTRKGKKQKQSPAEKTASTQQLCITRCIDQVKAGVICPAPESELTKIFEDNVYYWFTHGQKVMAIDSEFGRYFCGIVYDYSLFGLPERAIKQAPQIIPKYVLVEFKWHAEGTKDKEEFKFRFVHPLSLVRLQRSTLKYVTDVFGSGKIAYNLRYIESMRRVLRA